MRDYLRLLLLAALIAFSSQLQNSLDYEIKSLYGQPDYKSVNLTWETEEKPFGEKVNGALKRSFAIYYCELQSLSDHQRCKSKIVEDENKVDYKKQFKFYTIMVRNLKMATKYSFHVRAVNKLLEPKITGRMADAPDVTEKPANGVSIVIPTKGFSAHATQCLPEASEIVVETGPYFSGKIGSENGVCGIEGNAKDPRETYTMRIDHRKCGSRVDSTDLTVETYITVQESSSILTHSTRRFLVVCTFQPDTLTVRARLALPGKGGATAVDPDDLWPEGRSGRVRQFKMVDKSALILKESDEESQENSIAKAENLSNEIPQVHTVKQKLEPKQPRKKLEYLNEPRYSRLSADYENPRAYSFFGSVNAIIGISIAITLSVLLVFIFILKREARKQKVQHMERLQEIFN